jgi:phosphatidylserine decarboxylase
LSSSRKKAKITGEVQVKCGLADPAQPNASKEELQAAWDKFVQSTDRGSGGGLQALIDAPATESVGVGMIRADTDDSEVAQSAEDLDDEMSSSEVDETPEKKEKRSRLRALRRKMKQPFEFTQGQKDVLGVVFMEVQAARDLPPERNGIYRQSRSNC